MTLSYMPHIFNKSLAFHISPIVSSDGSAKVYFYSSFLPSNVIAVGGSYQTFALLNQTKSNHELTRYVFGLGFEVSIDRLVHIVLEAEIRMRTEGVRVPMLLDTCSPQVIISTPSCKLQPRAYSLANKLTSKGIQCDYRVYPVIETSRYQKQLKQFPGILCHVQIQRISSVSSSSHMRQHSFQTQPPLSGEYSASSSTATPPSLLSLPPSSTTDGSSETAAAGFNDSHQQRMMAARHDDNVSYQVEELVTRERRKKFDTEQTVVNYISNFVLGKQRKGLGMYAFG
eukprot:GHVQ01013147.1.p1 GENE.GHVQ01013147.1~~GHVQ01013147.1.p1  ORF type:complete len:310 (+),score=41.00 GHVQ01013147.1:78-932(+)